MKGRECRVAKAAVLNFRRDGERTNECTKQVGRVLSYLPPAYQLLLLVVTVSAGFADLRSRRIPNWLAGGGLLAGIALNWFVGGTDGLWFALKGAGVALAIYFPLFALRAMGAGDGKLMAAAGSIIGWGNWLGLFFLTAVMGGLLGLAVVFSKGRTWQTLRNIVHLLRELAYFRVPHASNQELALGREGSLSLPHGSVIALSSVVFIVILALWAPR